MALYVPSGRRRRNLILGLVGALVVGLLIGGIVGRVTAPTVSDRVASVRDSAREVTARLRATPLEYEQQLSGSSEFRGGGSVLDSLADARKDLRSTLGDAVWLGPAERREIEATLDQVIAGAREKVAAARYKELVDDAATRIDTALGADAR